MNYTAFLMQRQQHSSDCMIKQYRSIFRTISEYYTGSCIAIPAAKEGNCNTLVYNGEYTRWIAIYIPVVNNS